MILGDRLLHVFHWPAGYPIRLVLPGMLLLSILLHGAGLYLVRSSTPMRAVSLPPAPAKLTILPAGSAGVGNLVLATRDPSWLQPGRYRDLMLPMPRRAMTPRALQSPLPPLVAAPEPSVAETWVPALPPLSVQPWLVSRGEVSPAPVLAGVSVRFDPPGPAITEEAMGRLRAAVPKQPPGLPTEFLVVLDASGEARHLWLLRSSGVPSLDVAAQLAIQRSRFGSSAQGYRGVLRIIWGPGEGEE
jgi:hypothetical protein